MTSRLAKLSNVLAINLRDLRNETSVFDLFTPAPADQILSAAKLSWFVPFTPNAGEKDSMNLLHEAETHRKLLQPLEGMLHRSHIIQHFPCSSLPLGLRPSVSASASSRTSCSGVVTVPSILLERIASL